MIKATPLSPSTTSTKSQGLLTLLLQQLLQQPDLEQQLLILTQVNLTHLRSLLKTFMENLISQLQWNLQFY